MPSSDPATLPPAADGDAIPGDDSAARGTVIEVLLAFLRLGLTSFGGPVAHLGYFRAEFVERRRWLDDARYSDLVALCQFLPGPASSQVGMAIGLRRAGWGGALAAWLGFTAPSAVALILFAAGIARWQTLAQSGAVHGLKVVAVAIVAQAVWGMARSLCPDRPRAGLAIAAAIGVLMLPTASGQIAAIVAGGLAGRWLPRSGASASASASAAASQPADGEGAAGPGRRTGGLLLGLFAALLVALPLAATALASPALGVVADFYRAGALVFGGGHVVLPLLQAGVVPGGWVSNDVFLAGYGAAQAVPGPLFTFSAYLGAVMPHPFGGWAGGLALLAVTFVPAFLLVAGALPYWESLRRREGVRRALAGVNAAVVGVLLAALYDPVWTGAIRSNADVALGLAAFGLLMVGRVSPVVVVALAAAAGWMLGG